MAFLAALILSLSLCPAALADTDGTEPKITNQPDQLVLQLGAQTDRPGHKGAFSTYAYLLIRNEIYTQLEYATRRGRELATDPEELPYTLLDDDSVEQAESCSVLLRLLEQGEAGATGVIAKGFQAIRLLADGYSNREISERFGVPADHVTAWVAKARKRLRELNCNQALEEF